VIEPTQKYHKKYLVKPGYVLHGDGQRKYITGAQLIALYKVHPRECVVASSDFAPMPGRENGMNQSHLIVLAPRADGNYKLP